MTEPFSDVYRRNLWNGVESRSGPGSGPAATARLAAELLLLVDRYEIDSVLDVGCGDAYWQPPLPGYVGIDVAPEAIERARARHPDRIYLEVDPRDLIPQAFDLVVVRDVIQHLSLADGVALLENVRRSGSKLLLASSYCGAENVDIESGVDAYSANLEVEPFALGPPLEIILDGYDYAVAGEIRDPGKVLGLWRL